MGAGDPPPERFYMDEKKQADFVCKDGREIAFDFEQMSVGQWLGLFDTSESDEKSTQTIARVCGLTLKELKGLPYPEYKRLLVKFFERAREPDAAPNA